MQLVQDRLPGTILLLRLNADRILSTAAVLGCLMAGAYLASGMAGG